MRKVCVSDHQGSDRQGDTPLDLYHRQGDWYICIFSSVASIRCCDRSSQTEIQEVLECGSAAALIPNPFGV